MSSNPSQPAGRNDSRDPSLFAADALSPDQAPATFRVTADEPASAATKAEGKSSTKIEGISDGQSRVSASDVTRLKFNDSEPNSSSLNDVIEDGRPAIYGDYVTNVTGLIEGGRGVGEREQIGASNDVMGWTRGSCGAARISVDEYRDVCGKHYSVCTISDSERT